MNPIASRTRCLTGLVLLSFVAGVASAVAEPEEELKSATVLTFIRHAEWRWDAAGPIKIAVLGRPSMVLTLRRLLEGRTANNRPVLVVDAMAFTDLSACQVLYIASDNNSQIRQTLAAGRAIHALTIGESGQFLEYGGAVNLLIEDGHMSFEVSREALDRAGVTISSTLLRYGRIVETAPSRQARPHV